MSTERASTNYGDYVTTFGTRRDVRGSYLDRFTYESPLLPTRRFGFDAFAQFVAIASRAPGEPTRISRISGWILLDPSEYRLVGFLGRPLCLAYGEVPDFEIPPDPLPAVAEPAVAATARLAGQFFGGADPAPADRSDHLRWLQASRAAAELAVLAGAFEDFFTWLRWSPDAGSA